MAPDGPLGRNSNFRFKFQISINLTISDNFYCLFLSGTMWPFRALFDFSGNHCTLICILLMTKANNYSEFRYTYY